VPDESATSWEVFFRSLPERPSEILVHQWPHIVRAANRVWPGITIRHSTWHAWDYLRRAFNKAHWYPGTNQMVADGPAAFIDPVRFRAWRAQAESTAPQSVRKWLKKHGDVHLVRISGRGPYSTGPLEAFLGSVRRSLDGLQGVITNLPRLDMRLGLMAIGANRQSDPETLRSALLDVLGGDRLVYRELDSAPFAPDWVLSDFG